TFNLLYHIEHHLFPAVPTNHLPILAKRLDTSAPQWTQQPVIPLLAPVNKYSVVNTTEKVNSLDV
ncbi:MAG: fatty acid desaturase, partial [Psychrobacter sp.]